jgi:hypothetical protein
MDDVIRELFGWVVGIGMLLAGVALGLMVAGLVHLAAGAGAGRDDPLPPGVLWHAQELESACAVATCRGRSPRNRSCWDGPSRRPG